MTTTLKPGDTVVLATHNAAKAEELSRLLAPLGWRLLRADELGLPTPVEDGDSCEANALIKAKAAAERCGYPAIADDCGLFVDALDGGPGVEIARLARARGGWDQAMDAILAQVEDKPRGAHFVCGLAIAFPDGERLSVRGEAHGSLAVAPRGDQGHGLDPIFVPTGETRTFGELTPPEREAINHRAEALKALWRALGYAIVHG